MNDAQIQAVARAQAGESGLRLLRLQTSAALLAPLLQEEYRLARAKTPDGEMEVRTGAALAIAVQSSDQLLMALGFMRQPAGVQN